MAAPGLWQIYCSLRKGPLSIETDGAQRARVFSSALPSGQKLCIPSTDIPKLELPHIAQSFQLAHHTIFCIVEHYGVLKCPLANQAESTIHIVPS